MIVCDICRKEMGGTHRFTMTVVIAGGIALVNESSPIELVHACSAEHFVVALARTAHHHHAALRLAPGVLAQARDELAPRAPSPEGTNR